MIKEIEIVCKPAQHESLIALKKIAASAINIPIDKITSLKIIKRSIDARGRNVVYRMLMLVFMDEAYIPEIFTINYKNVRDAKPIIIVGAGPAGLFAALKCIELGFKPIILERGKDVKKRRRDLANINRQGTVNPESNYCFGEGGAGTYSDGKLYTRSTKRGDINSVLKTFVAHGATEDILIDARPHIGTNKLPQIISSISQSIINHGGEMHFETKVTNLLIAFGKIKGVKTSLNNEWKAEAVILATGHSANDIFEMLHRQRILIEPKPFALGVRIEHPQYIIDNAQYHCQLRDPHLPPAYYNLVEQVENRGVFSFCMCPGGIIAPCATAENEIVVNGWSPSKRNNPFANSGTVVQVNLEDVKGAEDNPLRMLYFQQNIELLAFNAGGGKLVAPAQRMVDFVENRLSNNLPINSYIPGVKSVALNEVLPNWISTRLKKAIPVFGKKMNGYFTNEAILVGVESRTSSPVKIPRDKETLQHPQIQGLFPCGEGAGYAGGIISAAIDGINCAIAASKFLS
jgi:uncharacterized FAD-dependent dehydrogenase